MVRFIFPFLSLPTWIAMLVMPLLVAPATAQTTPSNTDTTLSALTLAPGNLLSTFASDKTTYAFAVQSGATEITVTATPTNSGATVTITPADASATSGHQVAVSTLPVSIRIVVSPAMGTTTLTYTVSAGNFTDYDTDGDNLIELGAGQTGLAQLHAMRWDLNADGAIDTSATTSDTTAYNAAFPNRPPGMGCETTCTGYELTANLNFDENDDGAITSADATYWNIGEGWVPIGSNTTKYTGTFHGNDYTISTLFIDRSATSYIGLFGYAEGGTIRNLSLVNADVTGSAYTAVLVGQGNRLHLMHIRVTGQVSGLSDGGGLVGNLTHGSSTITACGAEVDVTGRGSRPYVDVRFGGLVGGNSGTITASYATGAVSNDNVYVGGLVGIHSGSSAVIRASYATGAVRGQTFFGGLVGTAFEGAITASYATGAVRGTGAVSYIGGLVGFNSSTSISYSYYDSTTTGQKDTGRGGPQSTAGLQNPTDYTGIYANWNLNLDGQTGNDNPWSFGTTSQYPVLKYAGMDTAAQFNAQRVGKPTGGMVAAKTDTLTVTWGLVRNATGYKVRWKSGALTYPTSDLADATRGQATIGSVLTTTYDISGLTAGTTYTVQVIATRLNAADSDPSDAVMLTPATTKPTNVHMTPVPLQLIVDWTKATGATGYKVQWKSGQQTYNTSSRQATVSDGSTTTYTIEGLTFGTTYTVRVTATLAGGTDSDPSDEVVGTPLKGLDMPTGVIVTPKVDTLDVRWTAVSTATGYKVQWKLYRRTYDVSRQAIVTGTRYAIPNLIAGAPYLVRVIATKAGLPGSAPSVEVPGVPLLRSPMGVMVAADMDTLTVTWNAVPNATGYKVQWKSGNLTYPTADLDSATRGQATIAGGNTTTHKISGLTAGTTYTIRVIATHTNVADSAPSAEVPGVPLLGKPTVMVAAKMDTLTVTWNAVPNATGYKVQWKSGNLTYPTADLDSATRGQATIAGGNTTTHKISGVTVGTLYAVRVIATSTNINIADSTPSDEVMVMPATNRPTNVRVTPGTTQLLVRWTEATGATGYKVQWKSGQQAYDPSSRQAQVSGVSTTTYTIENLTVSTTYTVRVLAILSGGVDSTPSDEVMGTPPGIDYDRDGDGLIDITTLAQLNAIRYDMDGNGDATHAVYAAAFPNRDTTSNVRMGCPSGTCTGYELLNNLDLSEGPSSWTSGVGWLPIGTWRIASRETYTGTFKGNNKTISNLYIARIFVNLPPGDTTTGWYVGLFSRVSGNISGLGLKNVNVRGQYYVSGLAGAQTGGRILGCFVTGRVESAVHTAGGLVGQSQGIIAASYTNAEVRSSRNRNNTGGLTPGGLVGHVIGEGQVIASYAIGPVAGHDNVGGLVGHFNGGNLSASYATGRVTGSINVGGLTGVGAFNVSHSYWDTESSGRPSSSGGTGQTTSALQSQTSYDDIYASWDVDVDGRSGNDDPWTFGAADQYPVLKYAGLDTAAQFAMQPPGIPTSVTVTPQAGTLDVRWRTASYATGYKVQWKSGMQSYAASRQTTVTDTLHKIPNLIIGTTYTVRVIATKTGARDGMPSAEQTGVISRLGIPTVMVAVKLDTLTVTWNVVTSATGYKVQWKSGNEMYPTADVASALRGQATIAGGSATTYKISGLTRGTTYTIRVIATSTNVADSAPSEEVTGVPMLERPTGVEVSATVDTLTVTWNAVDDATGYKVQWKTGSETYPNADVASALRGQATIAGGSATTYDISGLTVGTTYTIRVIATRTNVADSAPSEEVTGVPVLGSPTVMVAAKVDTLTVTWNAVDDATGYKVQWKTGSETYPNADVAAALRGQATIASGSATTYDISGLTVGTTYTIRVIATRTNVADSAPSEEVTGVPVLGSPTVMVAAEVDTLTVTWNAVDDATGYKVQWKTGSETYPNADVAAALRGQATIAGGNTTTHKISGLTAGTTYTIRVIATRTNVADSAPSEEVTGVPLLGSPTVMVAAKGDTLTVTWNAVNGATGYKVQWKSGAETYPNADVASATHGQATISDGSTTTYDISGLTVGMAYTIRVIATRTNVADSAPSEEVISILTLGSPTGVDVSATVDTLTVTWNAVTNATGYKVQWKSGSETYPNADSQAATHGQATIAGGSTTIHKISGLTTGMTYTIRVIATSTNINVADSVPSEEVMVTLATTRPTNVRVTPGPAQLIVAWTEATGATGYKIQWKSGGQSYNTSDRQTTVSGMSTTTYTIENLTFGATYTVRVTATLAGGTDSTPSDEVMGTPQAINYDRDGDGLIDIKTLAQLHAIRWDLNGDGVVADSDTMTYNAAFPNRVTTSNGRMGCPSGTCTGYELLNNLNFDENNDGAITQADTTYWNGGTGWIPIGTYTGTFKGNNKTISYLYMSYPHTNQRSNVGLFSIVSGDISGVGLLNVNVHATDTVGGLVGAQNGGRITGCYVTGFVEGARYGVGGLAGRLVSSGHIAACYSHATVQKWPNWYGSVLYEVGGLVGYLGNGASVTASYATGPVSGWGRTDASSAIGGLVGQNAGTITASYATGTATRNSNNHQTGGLFATGSGTGTDSYWDTESSDLSSSAGGTGYTTSALQSETDYNGIYATWNVDVDGRPGNDDPWTFGAADQYPVLKYAGMDTTVQFQRQPAIVTLTLMPSSISENGEVSTVSATLAHPSSAATTITVSAAPVSPVVASAFTLSNAKTLTIAAGATTSTGTVTITAVNDMTDAPDKRVTVSATVQGGNGGRLSSAVTLTLRDDDAAPTATLAASPLSISENLGVSTITATLSRLSISATTITVRPVADAYTVGTDSTITIAAGQTANASDTVAITAVDNAQDALDRSATVSGVSRNAHGAGSVTGVTLTLTDDDAAPDVTMVVSPALISENGAISTVTATLSHTSSAATTITVSVPTSSDYTLSTATTLTVAAGQTMSAGTVTITTVDNSQSSGNKTVTVSSTVGNSVGTGSVTAATLTIIDDEVAQVMLILSPASIAETGAVSTVTATLNRAATAATTITVSAEAVSPAVANDFTLSGTTTLTIAAGVTTSTGTVTITSVNDTTDAPDKGVTVSATVQGGNGASLSSAVTLTITDDEAAPDVALTLSPASIAETSGVSTITATLSHASSAATTITVRPVANAYTVGSDSTITIAAGSTANASDTVVITAVDNATDAPNNDVTVSVAVSNDQGVGSVTGTDLTITDDDAAPDVTLMLSPASISEAGGVSTVTATLTHPSSAATTITVRPVANAYTVGSDSTITIAAGSTANATDTVEITAVDNTQDAPNRNVTVSGVANNDQGAGSVTGAALTITDDDAAPDVTMMVAPALISEAGAVSTVTATLSHPSSAATTITVSASAVSPAVPGDFTLSGANTLTVAAGATTSTGTVTITTVDNSMSSGNKTVTVSASTVGNSIGTGSVTDATLTIIDDEVAQVTLVLSPASISEAGAVSTVTATLNRTVTAATTITVSAMAVSPAVAGDFTLSTTTTLTVAASVTTSTGTVTITTVNNTTDAPDKRVTVAATVAGGDGASLSSAVTLTITDDDEVPTVTLVLMPSSISENAEVSTVSATLSHPSSAITTITVSAEAVSPATASDFTLSSADTLIIAASETTSTGTVTITAVDNDDPADDKTVTVSATANNAQGITAPSPVTLTLTDDDAPSANLDVDGDGRVRLFSDIILVIRYVLFFRNEALLRGNVIEPTATRTTAQEIEPYLDTLVNQNILDVDGDGDVRLFSDIILIIRYVLFFRNEALLRGNVIEQNATRTTAQEIEPYIRSLYPDSHFQ